MAISSLLNYYAVQNGNHEFSALPEGTAAPPDQNPAAQLFQRLRLPQSAPARVEPSPGVTGALPAAPREATPSTDQCKSQRTLNDLVVQHRAESAHQAPATRQNFEFYIKVVVRHLDFDRDVASIRLADLRQLKSQLAEGRKSSTVNDLIWKGLGPLFKLAVEDELIAKSPLENLKRARKGEPERNQPNWEQAQLIETEVGRYAEETAIIVGLMRNFGVGQAEIKQLLGEHFDFAGRVIHFRRKKTGKAFDVPMFPHAKDFIERLNVGGRIKQGVAVVEWRNPRKALQSACERLELPAFEPRAIRRTFIVHALQNGIDPRLVARWQGHKDATLIFKVYGKFIDADYERQQAQKLSSGR